MYWFTVLTPTRNRRHAIHRVYESLLSQTFRSFEWLVVDNGSTDDTRDLVSRWQEESSLEIVYLTEFVEGKHHALNKGMAHAKGYLTVLQDDDDTCRSDTLATLRSLWLLIAPHERTLFAGIVSCCQDQHGRLVGKRFPADPMLDFMVRVKYSHRIWDEKYNCFLTSILLAHPFPSIPGTRCVPEGLVWGELFRRYKFVMTNQVLRTYFVGEDNDNLGSRHPSRFQRNGRGYLAAYLDEMKELDYFFSWPSHFLLLGTKIWRISCHINQVIDVLKEIENTRVSIILLITFPIGMIVYICDK